MAINRKVFIALVVLAAGVLGALYMMGYFTAEDAEYFGRRVFYKGKGAVGGAVDVLQAGGSGSGDPAKASQCRDNLRRIETAKRAAANALMIEVGDVPLDKVKEAIGGGWPSCPDGGRYSVNALNFVPTCSIGPGKASDPNDDHLINDF